MLIDNLELRNLFPADVTNIFYVGKDNLLLIYPY